MTSISRVIAILSALHSVNDGTVSLLPTLFPAAILLFGIGYIQLGILVSAGYLANVVVQPIAGHFSEAIEPKKLLALGIGIMGASAVIIAYAQNYSLLLIGAVFLRVGSSFYHPIANSVVSKITEVGKSADRRMGIQSAFGDLGSLVIFSGAALLYSFLGWKSPFLTFAVIDLAFSLLVYSLLGDINSEIGRPATRMASEVGSQTKMYEKDAATLTTSIANKRAENEEGDDPHKPSIAFFFVASFVGAGAYAITLNFANSFLSREYGSIVVADIIVSLWLAAFVAGDLMCAELSKRVLRTRLILIAYGVSALLGIVFSLSVHNSLFATFALVGNGFALSLTFPLVYSELGSRTRTEFGRTTSFSSSSGLMFGVLFTSQVMGSAVLAYLAGVLSSRIGLNIPFLVAGALLALIAVVGSVITAFRSILPR